MVIEIRQAWTSIKCYKCDNHMSQGSLYLYTSCMSGSYYYCPSCACKKGYSLADFESFRPESPDLSLDYENNKYDSWDNLKFNVDLIK